MRAMREGRTCGATPRIAGLVHVAPGATLGAIFAALPQTKRLDHGVGLGVAYGIGVYALNYACLAPALRLMPHHHHKDRPGRQLTTVVAHLVYGATLGRRLGRGVAD